MLLLERQSGVGAERGGEPDAGAEQHGKHDQAKFVDGSESAERLGVNRTDLRCLEILHQQESALPSQLGAQLRLTTGSVTAMLDRLERSGYISREPDPSDRRKTVVRMTPKARRAVWGRIYKPLVEDGFRSIEGFTSDDLTAVLDYLRRGRELYERHLARLQKKRE